jgi:hypothetical protein
MIGAILAFSILASAHPVKAQCTPLTLTVNGSSSVTVKSRRYANRGWNGEQLRYASRDDQRDSDNYAKRRHIGVVHKNLPTATWPNASREHQLPGAKRSRHVRGDGDKPQRRLCYCDGYGYVRTTGT